MKTNKSNYEALGGEQACQRLSQRFHERVVADPLLGRMFPKNVEALARHFALFLAEILGGPADYTARRGKPRLVCRHAPFPIGPPEVERWLFHMYAAMDELELPAAPQQQLREFFAQTAPTLSDPFISFYQMPLEALRAVLEGNRGLATATDEGRTLLQDAAGRWDPPRVRLLLEYGASVSEPDPLYRVANGRGRGREAEGRAVVEVLLQQGADVNARCGVGRMTPLHMAARRGTVVIAELLLAWGADIEAKDTKGETPLRRAVNCGQEGVVRLLLAHGADPRSQDRTGHSIQEVALRGRASMAAIFGSLSGGVAEGQR